MTDLLIALTIAFAIYLRFPFKSHTKKLQRKESKKFGKVKEENHPIRETREVVDLLVLTISTGMTIPNAITKTNLLCSHELANQLGNVIKSHNLGASVDAELIKVANIDRYWKLVVNQLRQSWERGATVLENLSELSDFLVDLEKSVTLQKVRSAGVRSVLPLGLCFLPAFILVVVIPLVAGLVTN